MISSLTEISEQAENFIRKHAVNETAEQYDRLDPLDGEFALHRDQSQADLYGMIDAVYSLYTIGRLEQRTSRSSRHIWATRILSCQDESGWFSKLNERGHSREHATAYAIGALRLLEIDSDEAYTDEVQPLSDILPILSDYDVFLDWIERLNFRLTVGDIRGKNLGWHYIWRSSHIGGGVPAAVGMLQQSVSEWWPHQVELEQWFQWYFDWLDSNVNPHTGYWQRAFWNSIYRKPTQIDMGGAVHFFWVYEGMGHPISSPTAVITSTLSLQRQSGYTHPCAGSSGEDIRNGYAQSYPIRIAHSSHRVIGQHDGPSSL